MGATYKVVALLVIFSVVCYCFGFLVGESVIKSSTIVRVGSPFYDGVFFGHCYDLKYGDYQFAQACATEEGS